LVSNQQLAAGQPLLQLAGTIFNPPNWRGRAGVLWDWRRAELGAFLNYLGPTRDNRFPAVETIPAFVTVDLSASFRTGPDAGPLRNLEFRLSALNLLNQKPHFIRNGAVCRGRGPEDLVMRAIAVFAALSAVVPSAARAAPVRAECAGILPPEQLREGKRALVPEDLARLRDIGPPEPQYYAEPFFTWSPDGRWLALQLRRGDPQRNAYCLAMVILDLSGEERPRIVDEGGDVILLTLDFRGIADFPMGYMSVVSPRWSGDGKWIAFLKHVNGRTQVWRAFADGSGSAPLTHSDSDVVDFRIGPDGSSIVYATRPGIARQQLEIDREGLNGWHYDDRFVPFLSKRPLPQAPVAREVQVLDPSSGKIRAPSREEADLVLTDHQIIANAGASPELDAAGLEITATNLTGGDKAGTLHARLRSGASATCTDPACEGAMKP